MITAIEARHYRCLRFIRQDLGGFHVLVGPNASGKSTFLDVVGFLGRLVSDGLDAAVRERTQNIEDLTWGRKGDGFELAIEARIPQERLDIVNQGKKRGFDTIRYEVQIGIDAASREYGIHHERALLKKGATAVAERNAVFQIGRAHV